MNSDFHTRVLLSVQRGLLGAITPEMRAIEVEYDRARILLRVFTEGECSLSNRQDFDMCAGTVSADLMELEPMPRVDAEFVRCDAPAWIPVHGTLVFARTGVITEVHLPMP